MKAALLIVLIASGTLASAQTILIRGHVVDSLDNPIPSATILLLHPVDSSLLSFAISAPDGKFQMKSSGKTDQLLKVTSVGFVPYLRTIALPSNTNTLDLGTIRMSIASNQLAAIEISGGPAPVIVRNDTIEFNAGAFTTREHAMVEELLKKLPGVEVDREGNITAQGEQVERVTIDGKNFFGTDPKLATRNLPASAVDKVQVFDKRSDEATFTGIDDGKRQKTINLQLKDDRKNAMFGNLLAGGGLDERYEAKASLNKFSKTSQLSFLGMGNNINESGFAISEYMNFTGKSRQMMGGRSVRMQVRSDNTSGVPLDFGNRANGIMSSYGGGININNDINSKTEINGSYFFNGLNHETDRETIRQNFLEDGTTFTSSEQRREYSTNANHRGELTVDHKIDSSNVLRFNADFSVNETESDQASEGTNYGADGLTMSGNHRQYFSQGSGMRLNSNLLYRHRFDKKGRAFSTSLQFRMSDNTSDGVLNALNSYAGSGSEAEALRQINNQSAALLTHGTTVSYTEPVGSGRYLEGNYTFTQSRNNVSREVFDLQQGEIVRNREQSNDYESQYAYQRAGINFRIAESNYNVVAGAHLQHTSLRGHISDTESMIEKNFTNILPSVRLNYNFSSTRHLRFDYETSVQEPAIEQLQPIIDNSDPLNLYTGNPELRPSYLQSWRVNFTAFNPVNFTSFFAFVDVNYTGNAIVNGQTIDDRLVRTIKPVNVSDAFSANTQLNLGMPIQKLNSRVNLSANLRGIRSAAYMNGEETYIRQTDVGGGVSYNYTYDGIVDLTLRMRFTRQEAEYESQVSEQLFFNETYGAEGNVNLLKGFTLSGDFEYLIYKNAGQDYEQQLPILHLSLSRSILRDKSAEIRLSVKNLFDEALAVDQSATINYTERVITQSLGRVYMVSFIYSLNKALDPMKGTRRREGRGVIRMQN